MTRLSVLSRKIKTAIFLVIPTKVCTFASKYWQTAATDGRNNASAEAPVQLLMVNNNDMSSYLENIET